MLREKLGVYAQGKEYSTHQVRDKAALVRIRSNKIPYLIVKHEEGSFILEWLDKSELPNIDEIVKIDLNKIENVLDKF